jgi:hypothetical protein
MKDIIFETRGLQDTAKGAATLAYNLVVLLSEKGLLNEKDLIALAATCPGLRLEEVVIQ